MFDNECRFLLICGVILLGKVKAVVLCAGLSSRMGTNKLLLPWADKTVIETTITNCLRSKIAGVTVVVGNQRERFKQILQPYQVDFVDNVCFSQGMSTSVRGGIERIAKDAETDGVLLLPGDMPFVKPDTIDRIIETYVDLHSSIVIPIFQGKKGHPVLFDRSLFPELHCILGDIGARKVVARHESSVYYLPVDDPGVHIDIDSPEEYSKWKLKAVSETK